MLTSLTPCANVALHVVVISCQGDPTDARLCSCFHIAYSFPFHIYITRFVLNECSLPYFVSIDFALGTAKYSSSLDPFAAGYKRFQGLRLLKMCQSQSFKYFAFGSNLLTQRIHINNPTARRYDIGLLEKYRLDFGYLAKRWSGYVATIVPDDSANVWGAIWDIGMENVEDLDRQEGVKDSIYTPLEVSVKTPSGEKVSCRCYCLVNQPEPPKMAGVPNLLPSKVYMDTVVRGAKESGLPEDYIKMLEAIPNNGYDGPVYYGDN